MVPGDSSDRCRARALPGISDKLIPCLGEPPLTVFDEVDALKARIDNFRPILPGKMELIDEKFTLGGTYHSNATEGNTLSHQETAFFLKRGLTVLGKTLRGYLGVQNHVGAIDWLERLVK